MNIPLHKLNKNLKTTYKKLMKMVLPSHFGGNKSCKTPSWWHLQSYLIILQFLKCECGIQAIICYLLVLNLTQISAISAWRHDFCGKYETIYPVFQSHSFCLFSRRFLPRKTFHKHSFFLLSAIFSVTALLQRRNTTSYVTGTCHVTFWPWAAFDARRWKNATFWSAKNITKAFIWPQSLLQWCFIRSEQ